MFVLEGVKPILELLDTAPQYIVSCVFTPEFLRLQPQPLKRRLQDNTRLQYGCSTSRFAQLSDLDTPTGLLAVVRQPTWDERSVLARTPVLGVFGDRLQDPTNLGTIIRTAAGLQADGLWLSPESVDVFNPKVVRATAGALFQLPIFAKASAKDLTEQGCTIIAAVPTATGSLSIRSMFTRPSRTIVAMGSESDGLTPDTLALAKHCVTIPLKQGIESLNVAAATAVLLFHLTGLPVTDQRG